MKKYKKHLHLLFIGALMLLIISGCKYPVAELNNTEIFIAQSQSPDGKYKLEAYRTEPNATVDFSVKVYLTEDGKNKMIYDVYHKSEAEIDWIDDTTVSINGTVLNLAKDEKYDWRDY